jgi:hypothetical protein
MTYIGVKDYWVERAIKNIEADYGDTVSVESKNKALIKFGVNPDIDTGASETIWQFGGNETYATGNDIDIVVSTDAGDTQAVIIEGHTISGSDLTFVTQTATLNGTTNVTLSTPLYRATRIYNDSSTDFIGTVTVEDNGTSVNLSTGGTGNQSLKCSTSLSSQDYWIITSIDISVRKTTNGAVDFELQIREPGKVFRTQYFISSHSNAGAELFMLQPCIIAPKNSDIRMVGTASVNNMAASASIHGVLAIVT